MGRQCAPWSSSRGALARSVKRRRRIIQCNLTVKLRGRTTTSDKRRGRTLSPSARGAKQTTHHGPLQRLLDVEPDEVTQLSVEWRLPAMANSQDRSVPRRYFGYRDRKSTRLNSSHM